MSREAKLLRERQNIGPRDAGLKMGQCQTCGRLAAGLDRVLVDRAEHGELLRRSTAPATGSLKVPSSSRILRASSSTEAFQSSSAGGAGRHGGRGVDGGVDVGARWAPRHSRTGSMMSPTRPPESGLRSRGAERELARGCGVSASATRVSPCCSSGVVVLSEAISMRLSSPLSGAGPT